jgi:hypothetical protein
MIQCPKCSFDNELGRIFCHQCGAKLELDQIKAPTEGAKLRRRVAGGVRKTVRTVIELVVAFGIIAFVVLVCLVPDVPELKPTNADLVGSDVKKRTLERLVAGKNPGSLEITQGELNTYVNALGFDRPKGAGMELAPVTLRLELGNGGVKAIYVGELRFGDSLHKQVYVAIAGTPSIVGGGFDFKTTGAWVGKLPLHPKLVELTGWPQSFLGHLFGRLEAEQDAIDKLSSITVTPGKAVLTYEPPAGK